MCQIMEDYANMVLERQARVLIRNVASNMIKAGKLSYDEISEYTSLPIDEIRSLAENAPLP